MTTPMASFLILLKAFTHTSIPGLLKPAINLNTQFVITSFAECESYFYIGTTHGLFSKNKQNGKIKILTKKNSGLPSNWITSMLCTSTGKTYLGTTAGLVLWQNFGFRTITATDQIPLDTCITALAEDKSGKIWIGTRHAGLYKSSMCAPWSFKVQSITFPNQQVHSITVDSKGLVWVGFTCGAFECFRNGISYNYSSIRAIELTRLKGTSSFLLTTCKEGAFICDENAIKNTALWPSYPNITCSYYNPNYSRMIICNGAGINIYTINEPYKPPRSMHYSAFIRAISCQNRDRELLKMIRLIEEDER